MNPYELTQFGALSDSTRRAILQRLLDGPLPVGKLEGSFSISRPAISQHLRILKQARLVMDRSEGTRRLYAIDPEGFLEMRVYLDRFWTDALAAFKQKVEEEGI